VVADFESQACGDLSLPVLDAVVAEFLDAPAINADDVVVVLAFVQFEDGRATLEVMAGHEPSRLELREHPVDRREADVLVRFEQPAVDVLGTHVARLAYREDLEDFQARHGDLQTGATKLRGFQGFRVLKQPRGKRGSCMIRGHYVRHGPATPDI